jgi:hypothetical protein
MSEPTKPPVPAPSPERRDITIEALSSLFAAGRIELEEFEARVERALKASTVEELDEVVADLHPRVSKPVVAAPPAPMGPDRPRSSRVTIALLSGVSRKGRWFPARRHTGIAVMGGSRLDFREAELQPGLTEVSLWVLWGGVEVVVPPDVDLEVDGWAIMGGLEEAAAHPRPLEESRRRLRVHARVLMGGVEVKVRERKGERSVEEDLPRDVRRKRLP